MTRRLVSYVAVAYLLAVTLPFSAQAATTAAAAKEHHTAAHHSGKAAAAPKIDLNSAPESQLAALPGIDEATAQKIVSMRPYKNSNQIVAKGIVTKEEFTKISHQVIARQPKPEAKSAEKPASKDAMKAPGSTEGTTK
ncbi:MAG TPA: helix-hairpin-helix domain-containing protein [Candidatus Eisenbacteria bacterium]|nr:helix-hairpin-helix domain-containing protein [Candidatus Eisenbacteria bacterium]